MHLDVSNDSIQFNSNIDIEYKFKIIINFKSINSYRHKWVLVEYVDRCCIGLYYNRCSYYLHPYKVIEFVAFADHRNDRFHLHCVFKKKAKHNSRLFMRIEKNG